MTRRFSYLIGFGLPAILLSILALHSVVRLVAFNSATEIPHLIQEEDLECDDHCVDVGQLPDGRLQEPDDALSAVSLPSNPGNTTTDLWRLAGSPQSVNRSKARSSVWRV
jgi:hypothetical protein